MDSRVTLGADGRRRLAIQAAKRVARGYGISSDSPVVLKDSNNTVVHLAPALVVAKVATTSLPGRRQALDRELAVLRHLSKMRAPTTRPSTLFPPGPHLYKGVRLTFLDFLEHMPGARIDHRDALETLRAVHEALRSYKGSLPYFTERFSDVQELLRDRSTSPTLSDSDRAFLLDAHGELTSALRPAEMRMQPLHGDPWAGGNMVRTSDGVALLDFEAACIGPFEWDYSVMPEEAIDANPDLDRDLLRLLRLLRSLCVSVWCWSQPGRAPEVDDAAVFHLERLRRALR